MTETTPDNAQNVQEKPPRDAASVILLRESDEGLQVLLMRRHGNSAVHGGAWVFPGGKVDALDADPQALSLLDHAPSEIAPRFGESALSAKASGAIFVAAARETFEEAGVLLAHPHHNQGVQSHRGQASTAPLTFEPQLRQEPFAPFLLRQALSLQTQSLAPWSRWITPRAPETEGRRFDTRFLLAILPSGQEASADEREITQMRWLLPRQALRLFAQHEIELAPPQIISLMHLSGHTSAQDAMAWAHVHTPYLIEPKALALGGKLHGVCFPGDPEHPNPQSVLPQGLPSRLVLKDKHFVPPQGLEPWL